MGHRVLQLDQALAPLVGLGLVADAAERKRPGNRLDARPAAPQVVRKPHPAGRVRRCCVRSYGAQLLTDSYPLRTGRVGAVCRTSCVIRQECTST
jgi:hypothetical protein